MQEIRPEKAQAFIDDLVAVCEKHNLSLSHEDGHGSFLVDDYNPRLVDWLRDASIAWSKRPRDVLP